MSKSERIINSFSSGLNWDDHINITDNKSYRYAMNIINNDNNQNTYISNEHSNRLVASYGSKIVGRKYINKINSTVILLQSGELHLFNHDNETTKFIASDSEFGCDWGFASCEWVQAWDYDNYICDMWLTYSSNKVYYNLNLSELLDPKRKAGLKQSLSSGCGEGCTVRTCEYFKVFKKSCDPHIEAIALQGGSLKNGTYFIGGRYKNNQGGYSNPFPMTPAIHVGGNNNIAGEISNQRIEITVQNASCVFDQIEFFVHEIVNASPITKALQPQYISGKKFTIQYTGSEDLPAIDKAELLINSRTYIEGEDLLIHDNRALYYRTTPEFEYNFQPIANQIQAFWYAVKVPLADVKTYGLKSFYRGETYAFAFSPNYENGKKGFGFHIPGVSGGGCASDPFAGTESLPSSTGGGSGSSGGGSSSGSNNTIDGFVGDNQSILLALGGCDGITTSPYYIDTNSFCTATQLYTNLDKTILAIEGDYKIEIGDSSFVRPWSGTEFTLGCNICISGGGSGGGQSSNTKPSVSGSTSIGGNASVNIKLGLLYKRIREACSKSTVNNPNEEKFIPILRETVEQWNTDMNDIANAIGPAIAPQEGCIDCGDESNVNLETQSTDCEDCETTGTITGEVSINVPTPKDELNQFANVKDDDKDKAIAQKDSPDAEKIGATWYNALSNYIFETKIEGNKPGFTESDNKIVGMSPAQILDNPVKTIAKFRDAAKDLIDAVERRERFYYDYKPHTIDGKGSFNYSSDSLSEYNRHEQDTTLSNDKGIRYDDDGNLIPYDIQSIQVEDGIYKKYPLVARGKLKPKQEKNSKYPCITDCNGNQIFCGLGGSVVTHHEMPKNSEIPFWVPKNTGDGSTYQTDADIMDGYAILLGVEFTNVNIPDSVKAKLCATNPYNIGMVKRGASNSRMLLKGMATETYTGQNQGKTYLYYKYSVNSMEKVSKHIDSDGEQKRFGGTADDTSNVTMYSLDQLTRTPFLNGTHLIREGIMEGTGARHMLYSKGLEPGDNRASRKDQSGSVHTVTMHSFSPSDARLPLLGQTYALANKVMSPPTGGSIPLMNKSGQSCAWLIAAGAGQGINDDSFVGDVLQDTAPITNARSGYFSVYRDLDDQYGDITSLNYTTILQARGFDLAPKGLVGDTYIGPYSFVKTGYVSDKVGNYFPISNMVPGKVDRCICDDPEDAIHSSVGQWYWKALPKDGDAADAKRWAGTHTTTITKTWSESRMQPTESHYYYPATTKCLTSYVGESEANPWLREKSEVLENQWFPEIKPIFSLHSKDTTGGNWIDGYLNLYYKLIEQASNLKLALKVLIKSFINIALPLLGISDWTSPESGIEFAGDMVGAVIQMAVWLMVSQVLFTNDFVDKFLGLESCKKDEDGGEEQKIEKFFMNFGNYNNDYSIDHFDPTIVGLPMEYTGCICTDLTMNKIYISDENDTGHYVNGYSVVRPNSAIMLEEAYGKLTKMYTIGSNLYLHTTDGIYGSNLGQVRVPTSVGELLLGSSNMITQPRLITNSAPEGAFGLDHPNHGVVTGLGFIFVDYNSKNLILFTGGGFEILSGPNTKMNKFFKEYLRFCNSDSCKFEQVEGTPYYAIGVDYRYNRILFTKSDKDNSYTLSYDIGSKKWISFHSYIPQEYLYDRNDLFSLHNNSIYKHDVTDKFTTYYGDFKGCMIDFNSILDQSTIQYQSTDIYTEAKIGHMRDRDVTFNQVAILNNWQTSGLINLNVIKSVDSNSANIPDINKDKTTSIDLTRVNNGFRFNEIRDYTQNYNAPVLIKDDCKPEPILTNYGDYSQVSQQTSEKNIVNDNYLYYRFIFSTFDSVKLYIKNIVTYVTNKPY